MSTRLDDELALPGFEERLWDALVARHPANAADHPGGAAGHPVGDHRSRRSRRTLALVAATLVVGAAVGAAVLAVDDDRPTTSIAPTLQPTTTESARVAPGNGDGGVQSPAPGVPETPPTTADHPRTRPDAVVVVEQRNVEGHVDRSWTDEATGRRRDLQLDAAGNPVFDSGWMSIDETEAGITIRSRDVDYCFQQYQEYDWGPPAEPGGEMPDWHLDVRDDVDLGILVPDGTEVIDGRELLRYRAPGYEGVTWADPANYAPVRVHNYVGSDAEYTQTYQYLPRTPENLAQLEPVVPPGFTQVDRLRGDGERLDAGCM
jgi:hypothetical protein